jgi:enamine deaminase RidA (YjgF/YER057c/UK114 family)
MPLDMEGQARAALDNLWRGWARLDVNRVWAEYFGSAKPAITTVQVVRLATDPRCLAEINAIAVID